MKRFLLSFFALTALISFSLTEDIKAAENDTISSENQKVTKSKLTIGGYGEAVYTRNFYSDNIFRYSHPDRYKDSPGYGRVDLPHVVIMLGYDFRHGWTMGSEIEFERGGEVALEQFWIQKSFSKALNIRMGHIIMPVGQTNNAHLPTQFFTCYRPEGEFTIMPCTWHETGVSIWGKIGKWRYEAVVVPGLNSNMFNNANVCAALVAHHADGLCHPAAQKNGSRIAEAT